jgi:hypothetical protein
MRTPWQSERRAGVEAPRVPHAAPKDVEYLVPLRGRGDAVAERALTSCHAMRAAS